MGWEKEGKETEGVRKVEEKKMSLPCGGLAAERAELKVFVSTKLLAKRYLSFF